jgi:hypothetical protein
MQAQPSVSFYCRVPAETDARRRRLQAALDRCSISELVDRALRELERSLGARSNCRPESSRDQHHNNHDPGAVAKKSPGQ